MQEIVIIINRMDMLRWLGSLTIRNPFALFFCMGIGLYWTFQIPLAAINVLGTIGIVLLLPIAWLANTAFYLSIYILTGWAYISLPSVSKGRIGEHVFRLEEKGLLEATSENETLIPYPSIKKIISGKHYLLILFNNRDGCYIPMRSNRDEIKEFSEALHNRLGGKPIHKAIVEPQIFFAIAFLGVVLTALYGQTTDEDSIASINGSENVQAFSNIVNSPEFYRGMEERLKLFSKEETINEEASWFGKTGLSNDVERELPRYLRREFGKTLFEEGSLKAADLTYVGAFPDGTNTIHYWRINNDPKTIYYAYVEVTSTGRTNLGWGDKKPAEGTASGT